MTVHVQGDAYSRQSCNYWYVDDSLGERAMTIVHDVGIKPVSYTHLTLPTIYSV